MTSREQFEETFRKAYPDIPPSHKDTMLEWYNHGTDDEPDWGYYSLLARQAFEWWELSREAVEIKLPPAINTEEIGVAISKERTMARLAFAGIKVK